MFGTFFGYGCGSRCKYCCNESGMDRYNPQLGFNDVESWIEINAQFGEELNGLSGGESILYPEHLKRAIEVGNSYGIKTNINSNMQWASSLSKAKIIIDKYDSAEWSTSVGEGHQEFVPVDHVVNFLLALTYKNIETNGANLLRLNVIETPNKSKNNVLHEISNALTFDNYSCTWDFKQGNFAVIISEPDQTATVTYRMFPWPVEEVGRAIGMKGLQEQVSFYCHNQTLTLAPISEEEKGVYRCCALGGIFDENLLITNKMGEEITADELRIAANADIVSNTLRIHSVPSVVSFIEEQFPGYELPNTKNVCKLCKHLKQGDQELVASLEGLLQVS